MCNRPLYIKLMYYPNLINFKDTRMPELSNLMAFALVSLGMVLTPGPNMIYLISRSICQGRVAGLISLVVLRWDLFFICCVLRSVSPLWWWLYLMPTTPCASVAHCTCFIWLGRPLNQAGAHPFEVRDLAKDSPRKLFSWASSPMCWTQKIAVMYLAIAAIHQSESRKCIDAIVCIGIDPNIH